jgi:hypothetical protein
MTTWHGYFAIEDVALTPDQRAAIIALLRELGPVSDPQPAHLMQFRPSLDGSRAIFEALFNADNLTVVSIKAKLAAAVGINASLIADSAQQTAYGPLVTYSVASVDRMRFLVFGGGAATWEESRVQARQFIIDNYAEWEDLEALENA